MRKLLLLVLVILLVAGAAAFAFRNKILSEWRASYRALSFNTKISPKPSPEKYQVMASELQRWRGELAVRYRSARTDEARAAVEQDARILLELALPEMMRCWLGTPWDFNGTASKPGGESIACGYFVSTILKDAGFGVDRYQLAKQPSENILRTFLPRESCKLTAGQDYQLFSSTMNSAGPGILIVGLDTHVAFIVTSAEGGFRFIHASGSKPWAVVDEGPKEAIVLQRSNWRMVGNLTGDKGVIRRWLRGERIPVHGI